MSSDDDLKIVATATDEMQKTLIMGRLSEAGIHCMGGAPERGWATTGRARDIYVRAADLERAREVLKADEGGFDEDELARLSEEAGKENAAEP
jgi:Putative prokaryotic signal transducing protein